MRRFIIYLVFFFWTCSVSIGQDLNLIPPGIKGAIISGNSKKLAVHFNQNVELLVKNKEDVYSKAQAELILKDFFNKNNPNDFIVEIEGESDGIIYAIGNLKTSNGHFRIYLAYQNIEGRSVINRLNISEYN